MTTRDVSPKDELENRLTDSKTLADLLIDGSHVGQPIGAETVSNAAHMIGINLRRVEELLAEGSAS